MSEQAYENCYGVINNHIIGKSTVDNRNLALVYDPDSVWGTNIAGRKFCIHGMKFWKANTTDITGPWDATKWTQTNTGNELGRITFKKDIATLTYSTSSTRYFGTYTAPTGYKILNAMFVTGYAGIVCAVNSANYYTGTNDIESISIQSVDTGQYGSLTSVTINVLAMIEKR